MVSIIIVSYNSGKEIRDCLDSIKQQSQKVDYEVIVVDNLSKDRTREIIEKEYPWVRLIKSRKNLGFGRGNNLGAQKAQGNYLFFLNPDTIMVNNLPLIIEEFFKDHSRAGAASPRQLDEKGQNRPENISVDPTLPNLLRNKFPRHRDWDKVQTIDLACGAALAVRKEIFDSIKGFDPDFFLYMGENDLCLRIRNAGFKIYYDPRGRIIHLSGRSIAFAPERKEIFYQSQDLFYKKHYSPLAGVLMKIIRYPLKVIKTHSL